MIEGKGMYLWQVWDCEGGFPDRIVRAALDANFSHVILKIADGIARYGANPIDRVDLVPTVIGALKDAGVRVWGFHYLYGNDPLAEARMGATRAKELGIDGYVIDAESEYKKRTAQAERYMGELAKLMPISMPLALSSFRFPTIHQTFPWKPFVKGVDLLMPQVYWMKATNSGSQLERTLKENLAMCQELGVDLPIVPTGAAFHENGWTAKPSEITEFVQKAREKRLTGFNFWEWGNARRYGLWDTVAGIDGGPVAPPPDPDPDRATGINMRVTVNTLYLRSGPGQNYPVIGSLSGNDQVTVLDLAGQNAWCKVHNQNGVFAGWACVQLGNVRFMEPQA